MVHVSILITLDRRGQNHLCGECRACTRRLVAALSLGQQPSAASSKSARPAVAVCRASGMPARCLTSV